MGTLGMRKCGVPSKGGFHYLAAWKRFRWGERFAGRRPVKKCRQKRPENRFRRHVRRKRRCSCAEAPLAKENIYSAKLACFVVRRERIGGASMAAKNIASLSAQAVERVRQPTCLAGRRHWGRIMPAENPYAKPGQHCSGLCRYSTRCIGPWPGQNR